MNLKEGRLYKIYYEDIDGLESFIGEYRGENRNGSMTFANVEDGAITIIDRIDMVTTQESN